jgi:hypothetical protein
VTAPKPMLDGRGTRLREEQRHHVDEIGPEPERPVAVARQDACAHGRETRGIDVRGSEDAALGAMSERTIEPGVLTGQHREARRPPTQEIEALRGDRAAVLDADHSLELGQAEHRLVREIDAGAVGDVVKRERLARVRGERLEMPTQSFLRRPRVIGAGDEIAVDRPGCGCVQAMDQLPRIAAAEPEEDRPLSRDRFRGHRDQPLDLAVVEGQRLARSGGEDEPVDGFGQIMPDQACKRLLVESAVGKRRDERQPDSLEP